MSFWDTLKPAKKAPVALSCAVAKDQLELTITWDDGHLSTLTGQRLRRACPCAECVEEFSGRALLDPASVPQDLKILEVAPVGNYALSFVFGDAHRTGIFTWALLRQL